MQRNFWLIKSANILSSNKISDDIYHTLVTHKNFFHFFFLQIQSHLVLFGYKGQGIPSLRYGRRTMATHCHIWKIILTAVVQWLHILKTEVCISLTLPFICVIWSAGNKKNLHFILYLIYNIYQSYNVFLKFTKTRTPCFWYISNRCAIFGLQPLVKLLWMLKVWKISKVLCIVFLLETFKSSYSLRRGNAWYCDLGHQ